MGKKKRINILPVIVIVIACLLFLFIGILFNMNHGIRSSEAKQRERMDFLRNHYSSEDYVPVTEQDFCSFDLAYELEEGIKYNELQYIATHNSYKEELTLFSKVFLNIFGPFFGMKKNQFEYSMPPLTEQLNTGIRFFELDLNYIKRKGEWEIICCHNPIMDNKSNAIDFELALEEVKLWSENNPGHLPITIFIEPKSEYLVPPILKEFGLSGIQEAEKIIETTFSNLFRPSEMLRDYSSFFEMTEANDWLPLSDMMGKILFVLFPDYNEEYMGIDTTMNAQTFFMSEWYHSYDKNFDKSAINAPFIMTNNPDTLYNGENAIETFLKKNFFVRTRLDFYPEIDPLRKELSIDLGAQLLTTDYPKGNKNADGYYASFNGRYMVKKKGEPVTDQH